MGECGGLNAVLSRSGQKWLESPHLSAPLPSAYLGNSQVGWGHYGHLSPSLRIWTKAKVGLPGTKCRRNAVFPEQYPSWLPVMACVLPSPGKLITA